ncbi:sugar phosphate isomerase/epimerase family protein [Brasilonema bromeliae]|uniref:Sugar phosphate isomerase/epimerase n=1 Tax=Brasilonema bromeliae SPC951 TaxID=385972 RepID=A0ABX1PDW1_9CYAN|nr:sugar phosphate isomerase/epimerase family protein [Brasilonema bromeliae]NMG22143.1 sugar phosphate isomerase/epimerase [Brasilonema bromeliae SPC951]
MTSPLDRRTFLAAGVGAAAALASGGPGSSASAQDAPVKKYKKAVKIGMVRAGATLVDKFKILKEIGFDGIELDSPNGFDKSEVLAARDESGLPIHGVVDSAHWKETLSHPSEEVRAKGLAALETAIRDAHAYGATSVLLVPAVVNKEVSYADAYTRSQAEIRKALPLAAELKIKILFENVWNNFLLSPLETARYIDEFESEWIGAYFDVGNVVLYGWPEQWIRTLGKRIGKLDVKEYSRKVAREKGTGAGFGVELLEGDCDWPAVMRALEEIGFTGWGTAEIPGGDETRLRAIAERMDKIYAS